MEVFPNDIQRQSLMFENSPVPFLPQRPEEHTWDNLPEKVKNGTVVGSLGPETHDAGEISFRLVSLRPEAYFFPKLMSKVASQH